MRVLATAGHVDHGKSSLVRALTGMEPDRWAEERRRGLTIGLGYAWMTLPSGRQLAFVDVPGHERFMANMLTGLVDACGVVFVVAADEGWAPQSAEHLAALDALGITHGLLVITRADLADPAAAREQAQEMISTSRLGLHASLAVSSTTGDGLAELTLSLDTMAASIPDPAQDGRVRLWIDRAFSIRGAGTVVTGTLGAGRLRIGDELDLDGRPVTVRGLESLGKHHDEVGAPARVAVNLRGVARADVARGAALLTVGAWPRTRLVDVRLEKVNGRMPRELMLHIGTTTVPVAVRPLGEDTARLTLPRELALSAGDRAVLRDPGRRAIICGAVVLDADPPQLRRRGAAAHRSAELGGATGRPDARIELARRGYLRRSELATLGVPDGQVADAVEIGDLLVDARTWQEWGRRLQDALEEYSAAHPLEAGLPIGQAARALAAPSPLVVKALADSLGLQQSAGRLQRPGAALDLDAAIPGLAALTERLQRTPFDPPQRPELAELGLGRRELAAAERGGRVLQLGDGVVLLADALERAVAALRTLDQPFTMSEARRALGTTRRVAVPLLERLDADGATRRIDGDHRELIAQQ